MSEQLPYDVLAAVAESRGDEARGLRHELAVANEEIERLQACCNAEHSKGAGFCYLPPGHDGDHECILSSTKWDH